jgi:hypothetical protein
MAQASQRPLRAAHLLKPPALPGDTYWMNADAWHPSARARSLARLRRQRSLARMARRGAPASCGAGARIGGPGAILTRYRRGLWLPP